MKGFVLAALLAALLVHTTNAAKPSKPCPRDFNPVCAKDGQVYANACVAEAAGQAVDFACGNRPNCEAACAKAHKPAKPCPKNYEPVCARDGKVYANACVAEAERKRVAFACGTRTDCAADCSAAAAAKRCPCRDGGYNRRSSPVCARNGSVYSSTCLLRCARATKCLQGGSRLRMPPDLRALVRPGWHCAREQMCGQLPVGCALPVQGRDGLQEQMPPRRRAVRRTH